MSQVHQCREIKRFLLVMPILPCLLALGGCLEKPGLECHDTQATDLVIKGVTSAFQKSVGTDANYEEYFDFKWKIRWLFPTTRKPANATVRCC